MPNSRYCRSFHTRVKDLIRGLRRMRCLLLTHTRRAFEPTVRCSPTCNDHDHHPSSRGCVGTPVRSHDSWHAPIMNQSTISTSDVRCLRNAVRKVLGESPPYPRHVCVGNQKNMRGQMVLLKFTFVPVDTHAADN